MTGGKGMIEGVRAPWDLRGRRVLTIVPRPGETTLTSTKLLISSTRYLAHAYEFRQSDNGKTFTLTFVPRRLTDFRGRIVSTEGSPVGTQVTVAYIQHWHCDFFGYIDCLSGARPIGRARVSRDGRFRIKLPDFVNDPTINRFSDGSTFVFYIADPGSGNVMFALTPQRAEARGDAIPVQAKYAGEVTFIAARPR